MKQEIQSSLIAEAMEKAREQRVICVDLDGTLAEEDKWKGYHYIGKPIQKTIKAVRSEKLKGTYVVIHTCRVTTVDNRVYPPSLRTIENWLKKHKVPYDEIWTGTGKPWGHEYWDDKAVKKP